MSYFEPLNECKRCDTCNGPTDGFYFYKNTFKTRYFCSIKCFNDFRGILKFLRVFKKN